MVLHMCRSRCVGATANHYGTNIGRSPNLANSIIYIVYTYAFSPGNSFVQLRQWDRQKQRKLWK